MAEVEHERLAAALDLVNRLPPVVTRFRISQSLYDRLEKMATFPSPEPQVDRLWGTPVVVDESLVGDAAVAEMSDGTEKVLHG